MRRACINETRRFIATGDYDMVFPAWPGRHALERMHAGDAALRAALTDALRHRTKGLTLPSMPPDFDAGQFVLGKVRPMVCGLFPAKERQVMLDLFGKALVFVDHRVPHCDEPDRTELVDALAAAVEARNGWKRILAHCSPPRRPRFAAAPSAAVPWTAFVDLQDQAVGFGWWTE